MVHDFVAQVRDFFKDNSGIIGVFISIISVFVGSKFFYGLVKARISHLEEQKDAAVVKFDDLRKSNDAMVNEFATTAGSLRQQVAELTLIKDKIISARRAFDDGDNVWLRRPLQVPDGYNGWFKGSIPILVIANFKGGVGKTTIAANLAAYFEEKGERVLAIDLDYQGSLSSMLLPDQVARAGRGARAVNALIDGTEDAEFVIANSFPMRAADGRSPRADCRVVACDDPFANFESKILLQWLIGDLNCDIRYNLASILHSGVIQRGFNRVIIDAPPRITAGFINALCAGTHLVVPFVLDVLSAERVGLFLANVKSMRAQLFPNLMLAGAVGTLKLYDTDTLSDTEGKAADEADRRISETWESGNVWRDAFIPRRQNISRAAGLRIAYYDSKDAKEIFGRLGSKFEFKTPRRLA